MSTKKTKQLTQDLIDGKAWKSKHISAYAQSKIEELEKRVLELETKLYYSRRNKKLTTCNHCNRSDGTCGCREDNK